MAIFTAIGTLLGATVAASAGAGIGAFGVGVAATALAGAAAGTSVYNTSKQTTASKKAAASQQAATTSALNEVKQAQDTASAQAVSAVSEKRKKMIAGSQTVFTSPLGISGQANIARKTLLRE